MPKAVARSSRSFAIGPLIQMSQSAISATPEELNIQPTARPAKPIPARTAARDRASRKTADALEVASLHDLPTGKRNALTPNRLTVRVATPTARGNKTGELF